MNCPHCGVVMRLLPGEKFWVHAFDKKVKCPITSVPNDSRIVALHSPLAPATTPPLEAA